jgi:hypothetical protein
MLVVEQNATLLVGIKRIRHILQRIMILPTVTIVWIVTIGPASVIILMFALTVVNAFARAVLLLV